MSKHKHRRTQSNSEVDLRNALCQQDDKKSIIEILHHQSQAQHQPPEKEVIIEKLDDDYVLQHLKDNCGLTFGNVKKKSNIQQQNNLFLIPEQNDLLSSVEQTQESGKKTTQGSKIQKRTNYSISEKNNDQKENIKSEHLRQNSSLINQIQAQLRDVTHLMNSDKLEPGNKMSFGKELQRKKVTNPIQVPFSHTTIIQPQQLNQQQQNQPQNTPIQVSPKNALQQQNTNLLSSQSKNQSALQRKENIQPNKNTTTPDRKRTPSMAINKPTGIEGQIQKSDQSQPHQNEQEKIKNNLSVSIFNNLFSNNKKLSISQNKQEQPNDSYRKFDNQMKKLEKEISSLKQRQDLQDEVNKTIQQQLLQVITETRKQREQSQLSLKKLEQLELITRRNEESIAYLRQNLGGKRIESNTHQTYFHKKILAILQNQAINIEDLLTQSVSIDICEKA